MNIAAFSIARSKLIYFTAVALALLGMFSYLKMGWLEDPDFSIKIAAIIVPYPGASPTAVEKDVVEVIETKLQEMPQLKRLSSLSRDGLAIIKVEIQDQYWADRLPQVWDEMRRKIKDAEPYLPEEAGTPIIRDDFGFVYGFLLSLTRDGPEQHDLDQYARKLQRELNLMPEVARIDMWGRQQRQVRVDFSPATLATHGVSEAEFSRAFQNHFRVVDAGFLEVGQRQFALDISGELKNIADIRNIEITLTNLEGRPEIVRLKDLAQVYYSYQEPPVQMLRSNGLPAIALAIAPSQGSNVVAVGRAIDARLAAFEATLPAGISVERIAWQSDYVAESITSFMLNLVAAIAIVFVVLSITMGFSMALVIGGVGLGLTVLGSIFFMELLAVDLHRVSLGALVVALGMMIDNTIVVADGFANKVRQGMDRRLAAIEAASMPALPLLGATIVGVMAFYPVFASVDNSAEYARTLFIVVALSLLLSWIISQTLIPLLCYRWIDVAPLSADSGGVAAYQHWALARLRGLLVALIRHRLLSLVLLAALLLVTLAAMPLVKTQFFPEAKRNQFMVDYWGVEGTRLRATSGAVQQLEEYLLAMPGVTTVTSFMGEGPPRFYLPVEPELPNSSYAQLLVTMESPQAVEGAVRELGAWVDGQHLDALVRVRKFGVGASENWPIKIRVRGPDEADPLVLRALSDQVARIAGQQPGIELVHQDWRQRTMQIRSNYSYQEGSWTGISRAEVANGIKRATDGQTAGFLRQGDERYPIVLRVRGLSPSEPFLDQINIRPSAGNFSVPLKQVNKNTEFRWHDAIIWRHDRYRTITVQAVPAQGLDAFSAVSAIKPELAALALPAGYSLELAGEYQSSIDAQHSLLNGVPLAVMVMVLIIVGLFNAFRPVVLIALIVPFASVGVILGHLATGVPIGFISVIGIFSLAGMMIKNVVVLLDEVDVFSAAGMNTYDALLAATQSRMLPVINTGLTTGLGMIPLLWDVFWQAMAVTVIFGLILGTILTILVLPVLYVILYRVKAPRMGLEPETG